MASPTECPPPDPIDAPAGCPCGTEGDPIFVEASLEVGDLTIGAVEIKDGVTDDRATVRGLGITAPGDFALQVADPVAIAELLAIHVDILAIEAAVDGLEALETAGNASLASIDAGTPAALGQATMAASQPVVIASDQSLIAVGGSAATSLGKVEDSVAASGDVGVPAMAVRRDAPVSGVGTDGDYAMLGVDVNGGLHVNLATKLAGEDQTNDVLKVEQQFTGFRVTADGQVKASAGILHAVQITPTGAVTGGTLTIYDSVTESGTVLFSVLIPVGITSIIMQLDRICTTGIYVGFDGTLANVQVSGAFR